MHRYELTDEQWQYIADYFPANGRRGGQWADHRRVLNGILWILCSGAAWRDLPERYGSFKTVHRRHLHWRREGTWEKILRGLRVQADARGLIDWSQWNVDATSIRATRHAAGARKKGGRNPANRKTMHWAYPVADLDPNCTCAPMDRATCCRRSSPAAIAMRAGSSGRWWDRWCSGRNAGRRVCAATRDTVQIRSDSGL